MCRFWNAASTSARQSADSAGLSTTKRSRTADNRSMASTDPIIDVLRFRWAPSQPQAAIGLVLDFATIPAKFPGALLGFSCGHRQAAGDTAGASEDPNNLAAGALRPGLTRGARMRKVAQRSDLVRSNLAKARHDPPEPPTGLPARCRAEPSLELGGRGLDL